MSNFVGCKHPCLFRFIKNIIKEQGTQEVRIAQMNAGQEPEKRKKKYGDFDKRLNSIVSTFDETLDSKGIIEYAQSLAHNIRF